MTNFEIDETEEESTAESRMDLKSLDLKTKLATQLRELEPSIFTENKIDFEALKAMLDGDVEEGTERYGLTWPGKRECMRIIQEQSTGTLVPDREESVDFDNTENIFIEGDNLEVLKLLQKSYSGKVKMIYIDPPYNTGKDFVYSDKFGDNLKNYFEKTGQLDNEGKKFSTNSDASGRYHSNWLNMIYPRLFLARNLLSSDGAIFISIDDNEVQNLRAACDQILGQDNFIASIIWKKKYGIQNDAKFFSNNHDYLICYAKNSEAYAQNLLPRTEEQNDRYKNKDNDPRGPWKPENLSVGRVTEKDIYEIITPSGRAVTPPQGRSWVVSMEKFKALEADNRIWFGFNGDAVPSAKRFLNEVKDGRTSSTIWEYTEVGHSDKAKKDLNKLFDGESYFDYPKPTELIKQLALLATNSENLVIDFFAGSGTTAHAMMQLNAEDGGNRKCISVQLPEPTPADSDARKAGYETIADIAKERIRRAGKKIKEENEGKLDFDSSKLDTGFKVFKLQESNFTLWDGKANADATQEEVTEQLSLAQNNVREGATQEAIVYEILLKKGYPLETSLKVKKLENGTIYTLAKEDQEDSLIICMEPKVTQELIDEIVNLKPIMTVFKDMAFAGNDQLKVNARKQFEGLNPDSTEKAFETV